MNMADTELDEVARAIARSANEKHPDSGSPIECLLSAALYLLVTRGEIVGMMMPRMTPPLSLTQIMAWMSEPVEAMEASEPNQEFPAPESPDLHTHEYALLISREIRIGPYTVDFLVTRTNRLDPSSAKHFVVECDGHDYHERTKEQAARDRKRDRELQTRGIPILRYTGSEIWASPIGVARDLAKSINTMAGADNV